MNYTISLWHFVYLMNQPIQFSAKMWHGVTEALVGVEDSELFNVLHIAVTRAL